MNGKRSLAHRISFFLSGGRTTSIKPFVLHKCDNPLCCNPSHLYSGDHRDNMDDMRERGRGRGPLGEDNHKAKLTNLDVLCIRKLYDEKEMTCRAIAKAFYISNQMVSFIGLRRNWTHI